MSFIYFTKMNLKKIFLFQTVVKQCWRRRYSHKVNVIKKLETDNSDILLIRNIGILAHIDAGKTTTTERMLYYSGTINQMGEVHDGNTVTDFMEQERLRGISITSASVTFSWGKNRINLLDTPGHIDFTMEVEQTLNVMDGAVIILDGAAGVEAQTLTVWKQADRYNIPRIIYVNKMDKPRAEFYESVNSIKNHLHVVPIVVQLPIIKESKFKGVVNLLSLEKCEWEESNQGGTYSQNALSSKDGKLWEEAVNARMKLTDTLADLDDTLAELIISSEEKLENMPAASLKESIRKATIQQKGFPVLCGSSYKNIGVELVLDAVVDYLPTPLCRNRELIDWFGENFCGRAFKVRHDCHKGAITFLRIYSGNLIKGQKIFNMRKKQTEQCGKLYVAYADDYEEVSNIGTGNIVAVTGLKETSTGELVTSSESVYRQVKKKTGDSEDILSSESYIPEPVFFCSIEAPSLSEQTALDKALSELEREDPSLKVTLNEETGQTVLGGMGELHLEIIRERLRSEYNLDAEVGALQIAYKETLIDDQKSNYKMTHKIGGDTHAVDITLSLLKTNDKTYGKLLLDRSFECIENISAIHPKHLSAVKSGVRSGLNSGPKLYCPVINVNAKLHHLEVAKRTSESTIISATVKCIKKILKSAGTNILEPIMLVDVSCIGEHMQIVMDDLGKRRGEIMSTDHRGFDVIIRAHVPLSELLGYSNDLRALTSGKASFTMESHSFRQLTPEKENEVVKSAFGYSI